MCETVLLLVAIGSVLRLGYSDLKTEADKKSSCLQFNFLPLAQSVKSPFQDRCCDGCSRPKMSTERNLSSLLLPPPTLPTRQRSTEEISSPSNFDVPDSFLISIFTFSFKKIFQRKKFRIIGNGIGTFIALVIYQHAVYDLLWFYSNQTIYVIYSISLLLGSILLLVLSRSLESIVQYDPIDNEQNFTLSIINETTYLCGYIDRDLVTCCGLDCTLHFNGYHIYILRIIRYNINAILISACWVGSDSSFGILTERVMNRRDAPRLGLDIFLLILSNLLLLYCGQLSGQMGVFNDDRVVESLSISETATVLENAITQIDQNSAATPAAEGTGVGTGGGGGVHTSVNGTYTPPSMIPLSTSQPTSQQRQERQEELSFDERFTERESSLIERSKMEISLHFKVTLTLAGVLIYWFSLWDLCWNYPREALIKTVYESRDDDVEPVDSYSRRHVSPKVEIYLMLIGVLYCIASSLVLILTGGLYSFVNNDTEETHAVGGSLSLSLPSIYPRPCNGWTDPS
jgi:hypothetical protein